MKTVRLRRVPILCLLSVLVLVATTGCQQLSRTPLNRVPIFSQAVAAAGGLHVEKSEPLLLAADESGKGHGYLSFPRILRWDADSIMVAYATEGDSVCPPYITTDAEGNLIDNSSFESPVLSTNGFASWDLRTTQGLAARHGAFAHLFKWHYFAIEQPFPAAGWVERADGSAFGIQRCVMAVEKGDAVGRYQAVGACMRRRADGTWEDPQDVFFTIPNQSKNIGGALAVSLGWDGVELSDGSLLIVGHSGGWLPYMSQQAPEATACFRSTDGGQTFELLSVLAGFRDASWGHEGPCEPGLVKLTDGELLCFMRTGAGWGRDAWAHPMAVGRSSDEGSTWAISKSSVEGVAPKLIQMSNGVLALGCGRPGLRLQFSLNGGRSWVKTVHLLKEGVLTTGYLDMIEIEPGRLFVVYDRQDYGEERNAFSEITKEGYNVVMGCFVDVEGPPEETAE